LNEWKRGAELLRPFEQLWAVGLGDGPDVAQDGAEVPHGLNHVAGASFAFAANHACTFADAA